MEYTYTSNYLNVEGRLPTYDDLQHVKFVCLYVCVYEHVLSGRSRKPIYEQKRLSFSALLDFEVTTGSTLTQPAVTIATGQAEKGSRVELDREV